MSHYEILRDIHQEYAQKEPLLRWGAKFVDLEECLPSHSKLCKLAMTMCRKWGCRQGLQYYLGAPNITGM